MESTNQMKIFILVLSILFHPSYFIRLGKRFLDFKLVALTRNLWRFHNTFLNIKCNDYQLGSQWFLGRSFRGRACCSGCLKETTPIKTMPLLLSFNRYSTNKRKKIKCTGRTFNYNSELASQVNSPIPGALIKNRRYILCPRIPFHWVEICSPSALTQKNCCGFNWWIAA